MRRLARYTLNAMTALSLLLCVATLALWVRTWSRNETFGWAGWKAEYAPRWQGYGVTTSGGRMSVYHFVSRGGRFDDPLSVNGDVPDMRPHLFHHEYGVRDSTGPAFRAVGRWVTADVYLAYLSAPPVAVALPLALLPALAARRLARARRARRRTLRGLCADCGYDLTANVSGVCPECGTTI